MQLSDYLRAGFPSLFLRTVEPEFTEGMIREEVKKISQLENASFGVWKATSGLMVGGVEKSSAASEKAKNFSDAIRYVMESNESIVGVFHNVRQFMQHYGNIQMMVDAIFKIRTTGSHILLVGPEIQLPVELRNMITFFDVPLPSKEELQGDFKKISEAYADNIELPKEDKDRELLYAQAATAALGLDRIGAENAFTLSISSKRKIDTVVIQSQKEDEVRKSDVLEFIHHPENIDEVGGFDEYKKWLGLRKRVFSLEAREYGLPYPKGVLLVGVAGSGKSLAAKSTASFLGLPLLRLDMGRIYRSYVGESEAAVRQALHVAEAVSPVLVWLDEIEKGFAGMNGSSTTDSGVTSRVLSTILTWRQETTFPVVFAATANDISALPPMVYRKGRFDEIWATDLPQQAERKAIFEIHLRKRKRDPKNFDVESLSSLTVDFTGAEIEGCIIDALFMAFDEGVEVSTTHIVRAIKETIPQSKRNPEEIQQVREWVKTRARMVSSPEMADKKIKSIRKVR